MCGLPGELSSTLNCAVRFPKSSPTCIHIWNNVDCPGCNNVADGPALVGPKLKSVLGKLPAGISVAFDMVSGPVPVLVMVKLFTLSSS